MRVATAMLRKEEPVLSQERRVNVRIYTGGDIGTKRLEKNNELLKQDPKG